MAPAVLAKLRLRSRRLRSSVGRPDGFAANIDRHNLLALKKIPDLLEGIAVHLRRAVDVIIGIGQAVERHGLDGPKRPCTGGSRHEGKGQPKCQSRKASFRALHSEFLPPGEKYGMGNGRGQASRAEQIFDYERVMPLPIQPQSDGKALTAPSSARRGP